MAVLQPGIDHDVIQKRCVTNWLQCDYQLL